MGPSGLSHRCHPSVRQRRCHPSVRQRRYHPWVRQHQRHPWVRPPPYRLWARQRRCHPSVPVVQQIQQVRHHPWDLVDRQVQLVELCGPDGLAYLSGDDFTVLPYIACGGHGVISVVANIAPRAMKALVVACRSGDLKKGLELQVAMAQNALHQAMSCEGDCGVKSAPSPTDRTFASEIK